MLTASYIRVITFFDPRAIITQLVNSTKLLAQRPLAVGSPPERGDLARDGKHLVGASGLRALLPVELVA